MVVARTSPFRLPFPRRVLVRIHRDLFQIDRYAQTYVGYSKALTILEKMVLVSEDRRFFRHNGIDYVSCLREVFRAVTFRKFGGASTIDMQFVRMATGYYERTLRRKLYEMLLACLIQFRYSKIEILRFYLKRAYFGTKLFGAKAAVVAVLGQVQWQEWDELAERDAATVASMLVYPRPRRPNDAWVARVSKRSDYLVSLYPRLKQRFEKLPSWEAV